MQKHVSSVLLVVWGALLLLALPAFAAYDGTNPAHVAALKAELTNDPQVLGLTAAMAVGDHGTAAKLLNQIRAGGAYQVDRENVLTYMLFASIDATEFSTLTVLQLTQLQVILSAGQVDLGKANIRAMLSAIFPPAGPTRTALAVLAKRQGSRAEVIWGTGSSPSASDITQAWRS